MENNQETLNPVKTKRDEYIIEIRKKKNEKALNAKRFKKTNPIDQENEIEFSNLSQFEVITFFEI